MLHHHINYHHKTTPKGLHNTTRTYMSIGAVGTFVMHFIHPEWEAVCFMAMSLVAVWADDIERRVFHDHFDHD